MKIFIIVFNSQAYDGDGYDHWIDSNKKYFHSSYKGAKLHVRILLKGKKNKSKFAIGFGSNQDSVTKKIYEIQEINLLD